MLKWIYFCCSVSHRPITEFFFLYTLQFSKSVFKILVPEVGEKVEELHLYVFLHDKNSLEIGKWKKWSINFFPWTLIMTFTVLVTNYCQFFFFLLFLCSGTEYSVCMKKFKIALGITPCSVITYHLLKIVKIFDGWVNLYCWILKFTVNIWC